jgi:hypothetical protein
MDRYTKVVLTIIAVSLGAIAIENAVSSTAQAQGGALQRVQLCDSQGVCAAITPGGSLWVRAEKG